MSGNVTGEPAESLRSKLLLTGGHCRPAGASGYTGPVAGCSSERTASFKARAILRGVVAAGVC
jgi:hypothetical protein